VNVAVQLEFKADRREPLGALIRRVVAAFEQAGLQPAIEATFSDSPGGIRPTSGVERALKKFPHLARFERNDPPVPNIPPIRRLTNFDGGHSFALADLLALADGVPRSLPFNAVNVHFAHPDFGTIQRFPVGVTPATGIAVGDVWWVNGRNRSLSAYYAVDADATSKKLPPPSATVGAILAAFGKPRSSAQFVSPADAAAEETTKETGRPPVPPAIADVAPIVAKYRSGMNAMLERIGLPYSLPSPLEATRDRLGAGASGPLKPTLVAAFKPRGYDCRGGGGVFTLRRRTPANHVVDLEIDVGTWSRSLTAMFHVQGPTFNATLFLPVTTRGAGQYPIGDTANWERIVANLGAIVDELDRTFVPEIDAAAGSAPEWFEPGRGS
jgi:hypothetical protein